MQKYSRKLNVELLETRIDKYDEYLFIDMEAGVRQGSRLLLCVLLGRLVNDLLVLVRVLLGQLCQVAVHLSQELQGPALPT